MTPSYFVEAVFLLPKIWLKKNLFITLLLFFSLLSYSQSSDFLISGKIISKEEKQPLEFATVHVERVRDSTLITYTLSGKNGNFKMEVNSDLKKIKLFISYLGYETIEKTIELDKSVIDLAIIEMNPDTNTLDEVVIKSRAPVTLKNGLIEFNVASFKTKNNASVEDLLKKLPGFEVNTNGQILVNGIGVDKLLVNGKPFFGDDLTIATRNLTKDIIEKVQVTDSRTKSEVFTGEEGDKNNKTINLIIDEDKNKGVFGQLAAGSGTDARYEYAGITNLFNNEQRVSVLVGGNNLNAPGFSFGQIQNMFGDDDSYEDGIVTSKNIGSNYTDEVSDGVDITADYFYSESDSENVVIFERENILANGSFFNNSNTNNKSDAKTHNLDIEADIEIDSTLLINFEPSFTFGKNRQTEISKEESIDKNNVTINQSTVNLFEESNVKNFYNGLYTTKIIGLKGGFLKFNLETEINENNGEEFLTSQTIFQDSSQEDISRNQFIDKKESYYRIRPSMIFRLPLRANELFFDVKFDYLVEDRQSTNSTFEYNSLSQDYDMFNTELSSDFTYTNKLITPGLELFYKREKWSLGLEGKYLLRTIENSDKLRPEQKLEQDLEAMELRTNFSYQFSESSSIHSGYSFANNPPTINQLQTFQDVSNPLNTVVGNQNLKPTNNHSIYLNYNSFNLKGKSGANVNINANFIEDQIITRSIVNENLLRNTTYDNVNGNYSINANMSFNKQVRLDSLRTLKFNLGSTIGQNRTINFNNDIKYASINRTIQPRVNFSFNWSNMLDFQGNYSLSLTQSKFDLDNLPNQNFTQHNLNFQNTFYFSKSLQWRNDVNYRYNPNVAENFQRSSWFWNSNLSYSFMNDNASITLKAFDILKQNTNAIRTARADYVQDVQSTVLEQYFLLSFSWKFNSLGKKARDNDNFFFF
ncbi:outer membrane beta-barrel protein [Yeosuana marina]|uniref:outer membrane beta-barrel protein n=1 Tax=Yeosuana marina TaxID=1565536 RepID=UPI001420C492|nr:outer membrane beta-barrel protein [Yeosuana marina]